MTLVTFQSRYKLGQCLEFLEDLFTEDAESGHMMTIVTGTGSVSVSQRVMELLSPLLRDVIASLPVIAAMTPVTIIVPDSDSDTVNKMMELLLRGQTNVETNKCPEAILSLTRCLHLNVENLTSSSVAYVQGTIRVRSLEELRGSSDTVNNNQALTVDGQCQEREAKGKIDIQDDEKHNGFEAQDTSPTKEEYREYEYEDTKQESDDIHLNLVSLPDPDVKKLNKNDKEVNIKTVSQQDKALKDDEFIESVLDPSMSGEI